MEATVYFVIPCYNEEAVLPETTRRMTDKLNAMRAAGLIGEKSRILYVDDGSKDRTWELVSQFNRENPWVEGVKLSHNRGHQHALLCGLMSAMPRCDAAISMDADLQDDIDALDQFVKKFQEGCDVVYGVRNKRDTDTWFKRTTAEGFYKVMQLLGVDVVFNHADYRLMSKRALEALSEYKEVNLFLRGHCAADRLPQRLRLLRPPRALCRREQVPPEEDALLRPGRHHQLQREALKADLQPGISLISVHEHSRACSTP